MSALAVFTGGSCRSSVEEAVDAALRSSWEGDEDEVYEYGGDGDEGEDDQRGGRRRRGGGGGGGGGLGEGRELEPSTKQLGLIYSLQLSEAIVAASLQPQLYALLRDSDLCANVYTAYWAGLLEAVFALGSITGIFWGWIGDRHGRKPLAIVGLLGLSMSCVAMGFSNSIVLCAAIRAFAGMMSACLRVAVAAMLGDLGPSSQAKARSFSRLPLVSAGGVIGPLLQAALANRFANDAGVWQRFPILMSQLACAGLLAAMLLANSVLLKETLPRGTPRDSDAEASRRGSESSDEFDEHTAFLRRSPRPALAGDNGCYGNGSDNDDRLQPIGFSEIVRSRSLMIILAVYSFFTLHSASFDQLLPLLGNSPTANGGLGLPCAFIAIVVLFGSLSAGAVICRFFGGSVQRFGLLPLLRLCCWAFPAIYVATPLLSQLAMATGSDAGILVASATAVFAKTLLAGLAQTLACILVTNSSPDPYSLATVVGFMQAASVFRSLAVTGTAVAFALGDELSMQATNCGLWATILTMSLAGAAVAHFVRDHPTVRDYSSSLRWEVCYDCCEGGLANEKDSD